MAKRGREPGILIPHLRAWRHKAFLSQKELATKVGVTDSTISFIENGKPASIPTVRKIAAALNLTPEQLLNEDPEKRGA